MSIDKTLQEWEGQDWGEPKFPSYLVIECHRLRRVRLRDFTIEDLRLMIGQQIGLEYLVPIALETLEQNPRISGDYYDGDVLSNVARLPATFCEEHPELMERCQGVRAAVGVWEGRCSEWTT